MRKILKCPALIIGLCILITAVFSVPLKNIRIESSIRQFFPKKQAAYQRLTDTENQYGSMIAIGVSLETPGPDILTTEYIDVIRKITEELESVKDAEDVTSISSIDYIESKEGAIQVSPLFDKDVSEPTTEEDLDVILERLTAWEEMYDLTVISDDGRCTQISLSVNPEASVAEQEVVLQQVREIVLSNIEGTDLEARFYGEPVISENAKAFMLSDLLCLIPLVVLVVLITLYLSFHTVEATVLPLITVLMSTIWSVGLMSILGFEFSIVSSVIPVALIGCGSAYGIHVLTHYYIVIDDTKKELDEKGEKFTKQLHVDCIITALHNVKTAVVLSAVTTIVGFASLVTSPLTPLFSFAIFTALGIAISLILSYVLIPCFLVLKKVEKIGIKSKYTNKYIQHIKSSVEKKMTAAASKHKKVSFADTLYNIYFFFAGTKPRLIITSLVIIILSAVGLSKIVIDTSMVNYFPESSQLRQDINYVNKNLAGTNSVYLLIKSPAARVKEMGKKLYDQADELEAAATAKAKGGEIDSATAEKIAAMRAEALQKMEEAKTLPNMTDPEVLKKVDVIQDYILTQYPELVGKAVSYTVSLKKINQVWHSSGAGETAAVFTEESDSAAAGDADFGMDFDFGGFDDFGFDDFGFDEADAETEADDTADYPDPTVAYEQKLDSVLSARQIESMLFKAYYRAGGRQGTIEKFIKELQRQLNFDGQAFYEIPYDPVKYQKASRDKLSGVISDYTMLLGDAMDRFTDDQQSFRPTAIRVQIQLKTNSTKIIGSFLEDVQAYTEKQLPAGYYMEPTGEGQMEYVMTNMVVSSQITSLMLSLLLVFIIISLSFKSPLAGIIGAIPLAFTIILNYMVMGLTGIRLDLFTSIIASVAIGVGIDYTIHFMTEYKTLRMNSDDLEAVTKGTFRSSGMGIITNAMAVGLGFIVLCLSRFVVLRAIGILIAIVMFTSSMLAMVILPSLFNILDPKFMHPGKPKANLED